MKKKHRTWIKRLVCPSCKSRGTMRTILYGMPGDDFDFDKFASGGCIVRGDGTDPDIACRDCEWVGLRNNLDHFYAESFLI